MNGKKVAEVTGSIIALAMVVFSREIGSFLDYHCPLPGYSGPTRKKDKEDAR